MNRLRSVGLAVCGVVAFVVVIIRLTIATNLSGSVMDKAFWLLVGLEVLSVLLKQVRPLLRNRA